MSDAYEPAGYVVDLAKLLVERCDALKLKGEKRDDECLSFWIGAAQGATLAGNARMGQHLGTIGAVIISVRGSFAVAELASKPPVAPRTTLTPEQATSAIRARVNGVFDDPDLMKIGPLSPSLAMDVAEIIRRVPTI